MLFNMTEAESLQPIESYEPELGFIDVVQESFKNFQSVHLSNSKDKNYKSIMETNSADWTKQDPDNEDLYNRIANYDVKDMEKLETLYEANKLDASYIQENLINNDVFLVEDFLKYKKLRPNEDLIGQANAKAVEDYTSSKKKLDESDRWFAEMVGSMGGVATDIKTLQTLPLGTWQAGGTLAQNAVRAFVEEMGIEALAQTSIAPEVYSYKKELGIKTSVLDETVTAVSSIVGAGLFRGAGSAIFDLTPAGKAALQMKDPGLYEDYMKINRSQVTDNIDDHAMNLQKVAFGGEVNNIAKPNEEGVRLSQQPEIVEVDDTFIFTDIKDIIDYDDMNFVSGKAIDGEVEVKSYRSVKEELETEAEYYRSIDKCLM